MKRVKPKILDLTDNVFFRPRWHRLGQINIITFQQSFCMPVIVFGGVLCVLAVVALVGSFSASRWGWIFHSSVFSFFFFFFLQWVDHRLFRAGWGEGGYIIRGERSLRLSVVNNVKRTSCFLPDYYFRGNVSVSRTMTPSASAAWTV